ncbi:MAG: LPS export ABC transporter periplasmic protein LptC [Candidatus Sericytochromatia bacterium]
MELIKSFFKILFTYGLFFVVFIGLCFWLWKNPVYNPVGPRVQSMSSQVDVKFKDVIVRGRKNGIPYWTVKSKVVESEKGTNRIFFKDKPSGQFYNLKDWSKSDNNNTTESDLNKSPTDRSRTFDWNSETAEYNMDNENLLLKNKVKILTDDKDKVETDELIWFHREEKVISNKRSKIISAKGTPEIKADKIEGNVKLDLLKLKGNVEITTDITEEQQM